jgi:anti-sigma regulatory factor (Ser/Thr protein kinase)
VLTRSRTVPSLPTAFVEARRFVREVVEGAVPPQTLDDTLLLTSELVTNAVRHVAHSTEDQIEVAVSVDERVLRVTVRDQGPGFEPNRRSARSQAGGWGLDLVRTLSSRWGVQRDDHGTDVWFEIDLARPATKG